MLNLDRIKNIFARSGGHDCLVSAPTTNRFTAPYSASNLQGDTAALGFSTDVYDAGEVTIGGVRVVSYKPVSSAWVPFISKSRDGRLYRCFKPDAPGKYGVFSYVGFPSDGSPTINIHTGKTVGALTTDGYPGVRTSRAGKTHNIRTHIAVAYLWGAPNVSGHPMSEQLVVDHEDGEERGNALNYALSNLRLTTQQHNAQKGNGVASSSSSSNAAAALGFSTDVYDAGEVTIGGVRVVSYKPVSSAWVPFISKSRDGRLYRCFKPDAPGKYGVFSYVGFPSDGSPTINIHTGKTVGSTTTDGYPFLATKRKIDGEVVQFNLKTHIAVSYLWGAPNASGHPMSEMLVVDHIKEGNKLNFAASNLQLLTQTQNAKKGNEKKKGSGASSAAAGSTSSSSVSRAAAPAPSAAAPSSGIPLTPLQAAPSTSAVSSNSAVAATASWSGIGLSSGLFGRTGAAATVKRPQPQPLQLSLSFGSSSNGASSSGAKPPPRACACTCACQQRWLQLQRCSWIRRCGHGGRRAAAEAPWQSQLQQQ